MIKCKGEDQKEGGTGDEEIWELTQGPISQEANIPIGRLNVGVDRRREFRAPFYVARKIVQAENGICDGLKANERQNHRRDEANGFDE